MDFDSITAANQRNSPLLRLPAELRNKIYLYAFDDNHICLTMNRRGLSNCPSYPMNLAQSCTQCRHEALPYFWQNTVFHLIYGGLGSLLYDTSKSMRDQIEIVRPSYGVAYDLRQGSRGHPGAFTRVQKVIIAFEWLKCSTKVAKETFGRDAVVVYPEGKGNVVR